MTDTLSNKAAEIVVTQADREAAADVWHNYVAKPGECIAEKAIRAGGDMDRRPLTQAFARHRVAAERSRPTLSNKAAEITDELIAGLGRGEIWAQGKAIDILTALRTTHSPSEAEAAAPELLSVVERFIALPSGAWHPERHAAEEAELMQEAKALVAKAKGTPA